MTAKDKVLPKVTEKGVLEESIKKLMSPGAIKELGALSPTLQQFLLRFMDYSLMEHDEEHDKILSDTLKKELKEFLRDIHEKDNEEVCRNVAEIVVAQNKRFFKAIDDQTESIKEIQFSMKKIVSSVSDIQSDIREIKRQITDVEERVSAEDVRILKLESYVKPKWIVVRIAVTIIIAMLGTLLLHYWLAEPLHKIFIK